MLGQAAVQGTKEHCRQDTERPKSWSVNNLAGGWSDFKLGEDLADFFSAISQQSAPLRCSAILRTFDREVVSPTTGEVAARLVSMKKPFSSVSRERGKMWTSLQCQQNGSSIIYQIKYNKEEI